MIRILPRGHLVPLVTAALVTAGLTLGRLVTTGFALGPLATTGHAMRPIFTVDLAPKPLVAATLPAVAGTPGSRTSVAAPLAFLPPDAQGAAMGEALTALTRGPEAAWWNPAALALGRGLRGIPYSRNDRLLPWEDARLEQFAAAYGGGGLGLGATWTRELIDARRPVFRPDGTPLYFRSRRQVATVGMGIDLSRFAVSLPRAARLAVGAAARGYRDELDHGGSSNPPGGNNDEFDHGGSARPEGWDLDGAALLTWRLAEPSRPDEEQGAPGITSDLCLGYVAMNALDRQHATSLGRLSMGRRDRASGALTLRVPVRWPGTDWFSVAAAFERRGFALRAGRQDRAVDHVGGEISLGGFVAVRAGQVRDPLHEGPGAKERRSTWGGGLALPPGNKRSRRPGLGIDYADLGNRDPGGETVKQVTVSVWIR
jgi:hypothetical protein